MRDAGSRPKSRKCQDVLAQDLVETGHEDQVGTALSEELKAVSGGHAGSYGMESEVRRTVRAIGVRRNTETARITAGEYRRQIKARIGPDRPQDFVSETSQAEEHCSDHSEVA
jgi:hypothetical protein